MKSHGSSPLPTEWSLFRRNKWQTMPPKKSWKWHFVDEECGATLLGLRLMFLAVVEYNTCVTYTIFIRSFSTFSIVSALHIQWAAHHGKWKLVPFQIVRILMRILCAPCFAFGERDLRLPWLWRIFDQLRPSRTSRTKTKIFRQNVCSKYVSRNRGLHHEKYDAISCNLRICND